MPTSLANKHHPSSTIDLAADATPERVLLAFEQAPAAERPRLLARLVGQVYEQAPLGLRRLLLERLLRPLGLLASVSIAGGVFATMRLRTHASGSPPGLDDVRSVSVADVLALVERVQQASANALPAIADVVAGSPVLAGSAAASALLVLLLHARSERAGDDFHA